MDRSSKTLTVVIGIAAIVFVIIVLGIVVRVNVAGQNNVARGESDAIASFPVPEASTVVLPLNVGKGPPSATQSWRTTGSLDEACATWRELFRTWVDPTVNSTGGEVQPGVSCSFTGKKSGFDATLRVASYGSQSPEATLSVVGTASGE